MCVPSSRSSLKLRHSRGSQLWSSYVLYRVRKRKNSASGIFLDIQKAAEQFCSLTGEDYDRAIEGLCSFLHQNSSHINLCPACIVRIDNPDEHYTTRLNLLSAAAYFGHVDLAKQLLGQGCCPADRGLFYSPMQIAALSGKKDVLILFQEHLPDYRDRSTA